MLNAYTFDLFCLQVTLQAKCALFLKNYYILNTYPIAIVYLDNFLFMKKKMLIDCYI